MYWAIVGLILEVRHQENDNVVVPELAKRILEKIDLSCLDAKLMVEHKNLSIIVNELAHDHAGTLSALSLKSKMDPSDNILLSIKTNQRLGNYEEAKSICISRLELESSSFLDSSIWLLFLDLLEKSHDGIVIARKLLSAIEASGDVRGAKNAALDLKIIYPQSFPESAAELLFNFSDEMRCKPSTLNDAIYFLKKMSPEDNLSFYSKISEYINTVLNFKEFMNFSLSRLLRSTILRINLCIFTYIVTCHQLQRPSYPLVIELKCI